jgi:hypothetical protein
LPSGGTDFGKQTRGTSGGAWTRNPEDAQKTFDLLASTDKELFWIENTTKRFKDGYNYFGRHPEKVIAFFDRYMK